MSEKEQNLDAAFDRTQSYSGYEVSVLADSISPQGDRLTTLDVTFPRFVLSEFNTHKVFSRNSTSSRAIPVEKQLVKLLDTGYTPIYWGQNQSGMQADLPISMEGLARAEALWDWARNAMVVGAVALQGGTDRLKDRALAERIEQIKKLYTAPADLDEAVHKQFANRILEPFMWHEVIVTATDWDNFYALRVHQDAQPEIQVAAYMMKRAQEESEPKELESGEWHTPLIREDELDLPPEVKLKVAVGRCARVSYLTHEGIRDIEKDLELYDRLVSSGHMSPTEHVATPFSEADWELVHALKDMILASELEEGKKHNLLLQVERSGNLRGWHQYRKFLPYEDNFGARQPSV